MINNRIVSSVILQESDDKESLAIMGFEDDLVGEDDAGKYTGSRQGNNANVIEDRFATFEEDAFLPTSVSHLERFDTMVTQSLSPALASAYVGDMLRYDPSALHRMDEEGNSLLMLAIAQGNSVLCEAILNIDPNLIEAVNVQYQNCLAQAVLRNDEALLDVFEPFTQYHHVVHMDNFGYTALHWALMSCNETLVMRLAIMHPTALLINTNLHDSCLHLVVREGRASLLAQLLNNLHSVTILLLMRTGSSHATPLELATIFVQEECRKLLEPALSSIRKRNETDKVLQKRLASTARMRVLRQTSDVGDDSS
ncbi:uncharacterized protein MONBRDRAFT_30847 [Monosiga brevicollis MX1]|uniref:Uncharacterized protein n=1 Tax=Monosiga brevicollis TaxID=81824 RepID=A9UPP7_MONBE|nr:uncharacterized protein MONBRDRAFT_30847 [Monosiga brevicollis MX1]EDQ92907.1 predicted protein [Monosiga brevicollis MX1]|eukprot:XP_001742669.1 hypothetical protein [Monosiga brevicollis MX1]